MSNQKRLIDANGNYTLRANDNTDYSICFSDGIISVIDEHGHCICEFDAEDIPVEETVCAHWIPCDYSDEIYICSSCGFHENKYHGKADCCPKCGVKTL